MKAGQFEMVKRRVVSKASNKPKISSASYSQRSLVSVPTALKQRCRPRSKSSKKLVKQPSSVLKRNPSARSMPKNQTISSKPSLPRTTSCLKRPPSLKVFNQP